MKSAELRSRFLNFFREYGHEIVPSSSLVPANDPTLLFTNAGMVQFKDIFLGRERRDYSRAASSQRCVRAGGKHNDLENVGYTARHHTFFEMLGNFSFGDYFKREAIAFAWEFLTGELQLPPERLWVTVYAGDDEATRIWLKEIGVDPMRFSRIGDKPGGRRYESDNFWTMGDVGPCGPCTEIFYDHGPSIPGGPPGSPDEDSDRYIEIWNLVFMQYERDREGRLAPLPRPSVDTGMGLERLAAVLQGVHSNYEIDLFQNLMRSIADIAGVEDMGNPSLRVIADHIRSCSFLIIDGVVPSNEGRGYVLRRIIRRAARHGHRIGLREPFFYRLVGPLIAEMGAAYPELATTQKHVEMVLRQEEERFAETLEHGLRLLEQAVEELSGRILSGDLLFRLYDTYGFPIDLTVDIAREQGLQVDMDGFERAMAEQRARARAASRFDAGYGHNLKLEQGSEFTGYDYLEEEVEVIGLYRENQSVSRLEAGEEGLVVLNRTPFYAEAGGQVGDAGELTTSVGSFQVMDTRKYGSTSGHIGRMSQGRLTCGDQAKARVDVERRQAVTRNHSATHLLHEALRRILGEHVEQKGSRVSADRLRFDFSHPQPVTRTEIRGIEHLVNTQIRTNTPVRTRMMSIEEAHQSGARALFGEKYGDQVRVLDIGFSTELCGGTHVQRTGDISLFKVIGESGVAAGIRRIEAITGAVALEWIETQEDQLHAVAELLKTSPKEIENRLVQLLEECRRLERSLEQVQDRLLSSTGDQLAQQATSIAGIKVLTARIDGMDAKAMRETIDRLKDRLGKAAIVLGGVTTGGKVTLIAGVTKPETRLIRASDLVSQAARQVGGKGGGRPDMAQAGGGSPEKIDQALKAVYLWVEGCLKEGAG